MLTELLQERKIPPVLPKEQALDVLQREEYGFLPEKPSALSFTAEENIIPRFCAGKAELHRITASCTVRGKPFVFPFSAVLPTDGRRHPFFIHINFRDAVFSFVNGIHRACLFTRYRDKRNGVVRACQFTRPAVFAFIGINKRTSVNKTNRSEFARLLARAR